MTHVYTVITNVSEDEYEFLGCFDDLELAVGIANQNGNWANIYKCDFRGNTKLLRKTPKTFVISHHPKYKVGYVVGIQEGLDNVEKTIREHAKTLTDRVDLKISRTEGSVYCQVFAEGTRERIADYATIANTFNYEDVCIT